MAPVADGQTIGPLLALLVAVTGLVGIAVTNGNISAFHGGKPVLHDFPSNFFSSFAESPDDAVERVFAELDDKLDLGGIDSIQTEVTGRNNKLQDVDQFLRSLQQRSGASESYLDSKLHGTGFFDNSKQSNEYTTAVNNGMAMPRSYAGSGPNEMGADSTTRSGSGSGGGHYSRKGSKGSKGSKGTKGTSKSGRKKKKQAKRGKGSKKSIDKKLAVDGYFDDWFEPFTDDVYDDDWAYSDWGWGYEYGASETETFRSGGQVEIEPTISPAPTITSSPTWVGQLSDEMTILGRASVQSQLDGDIAEESSSESSNSKTSDQQGLTFSFPTIQHMIYSGSIHLKSHSIHDLSELDPEIFAVLQSLLTPYLQAIVGHTLQAYSLEVDYTPGYPQDQSSVAPGIVVTNLEVTCTLKVRSDSVTSLKRITHKQANQWIRDFFSGSERTQFLTKLQNNNIHVNEIVFVEDSFTTLPKDGQTIAGINSGGTSHSTAFKSGDSDDGNTGVVVGVTMALLAVGGLLFLHLTGNLPSREDFRNFGHSLKERLRLESGSDSAGGSEDEEDGISPKARRRRTWSATFRRHPDAGIRKAAIQKAPAYSDDYLSQCSKSTESRQSKSSGVNTSSTPSSSPKSPRSPGANETTPSEFGSGFDDYSFSVSGDYNVNADYDMAMKSQGSPSRRSPVSRGNSPRTDTYHTREDEFSMPDDYDSVMEGDAESLYSKWSHSVMTFMPGRKNKNNRDKMSVISPPPGSPRRVTPSDLASPRDRKARRNLDAWSVDSYDTKSPSMSGMYRDFPSDPNNMKSPTSRSSSKRTKLAMPSFN